MADNAQSPELAARKRKESPLILFFSGIVIGLIVLALWISISSIVEKIRISQGLQQIISIVALARDTAATNAIIVSSEQHDLLAALEHAGRLRPDSTVDNVRVLKNPWGNYVVAVINPDSTVRVETIVPPHICQRFISSFGQNPQAYGIRQVEVKGYANAWRQIYNGTKGGISEAVIAAGCGDTVQADAALTFSLH